MMSLKNTPPNLLHAFFKFKSNGNNNNIIIPIHFLLPSITHLSSSFQFLGAFNFSSTSCNTFSLSNCHDDHHRSPSNFQKVTNLDDALKLFDEMSQRRPLPYVVKFNQLLTAVTKMKHFHTTLDLFKQMCVIGVPVNEVSMNIAIRCCCQLYRTNDAFALLASCFMRAIVPDVFTFSTLLDGLIREDRIVEAERLFKKLIKRKLCEPDVFMYSTMIKGLCKFGANDIAISLLRLMDERDCKPNVVTYNTIIDSLCKDKMIDEAFKLFKEMVFTKGIVPNVITYTSLIHGLCLVGRWDEVSKMLKEMEDVRISPTLQTYSILVDACCKEGKVGEAEAVIGMMVERGVAPNIVAYSSLIEGYCLRGEMTKARRVFDELRSRGLVPNVITYNSLLNGYCKNLNIEEAMHMFLEMKRKGLKLDIVTYNTMLQGLFQVGRCEDAHKLFDEMRAQGIGFNEMTLLAILISAASLQVVNVSEQVHGLLLQSGFQSDPFVINSLIDSYAKCGSVEKARKVFDESVIADLATFTSLISAYAQSGQGEEAIKLYLRMQDSELKPDWFICSSLLNTSASLSAYGQGKQIHVHTLKYGLLSDTFTANSLVNMYARCGSIDDATRAFSELTEKDIVSWSVMIGGFAQNGHGKEALSLFDEMLKDRIVPDSVTLVSVLCACNHAGLVTEAIQYFETMEDLFGIKPSQDHYACMIDILARAGKLHEAMQLVNNMPFEANAFVWGALLGAAKTHKNVEIGQTAAQKLMLLDPEKSGTHVRLANIYASAGLWENVADVRRLMKDSKVKDEPGMSWLEVK